jgi:hypothetical protein
MLLSFFGCRGRRASAGRPGPRRGFRPTRLFLETLEDRTVPAVFNVASDAVRRLISFPVP